MIRCCNMPLSVTRTGNETMTRFSQSTAVFSSSLPLPLSFAEAVTRSFASVSYLFICSCLILALVCSSICMSMRVVSDRMEGGERRRRRRYEPENTPSRGNKFATEIRERWRRLFSYFNFNIFMFFDLKWFKNLYSYSKTLTLTNSNIWIWNMTAILWHSLSANN